MAADPVTVGVLSLHTSKETKAILNAIEALGHEPVWLRRENTTVHLADEGVSLDPDVDVVLNRLLVSRSDHPAELLGLAGVYEDVVPVLNRPTCVLRAMHKVAAATTLDAAGLPVPEAYLGLHPETLQAGRDRFSDRAVYKLAVGTHGSGTTLHDAADPLLPKGLDRQAFLQAFIESDAERPRDYRAYVVDGELEGVMRRTARVGEFRTNVAEGGEVEDASEALPRSARDVTMEAAEVIGLDYAGIDLIGRDGDWSILEVNPTAGFRGFFKATGHSPAPAIARLGIEAGGGSVDPARVEDLAHVLDDSSPPGIPPSRSPRSGPRTAIGYTERIAVTGTDGTELVVAKSDTGAKRTSIDLELAATVGAGPIRRQTTVRSGIQQRSKSRPVVELLIGVDGDWHTVDASVEDRGHMDFPVLLGRDVLEHYHVDVRRRVDDDS